MTPEEQFKERYDDSSIKEIDISTMSRSTFERALLFFYEQGRSDRFDDVCERYNLSLKDNNDAMADLRERQIDRRFEA